MRVKEVKSLPRACCDGRQHGRVAAGGRRIVVTIVPRCAAGMYIDAIVNPRRQWPYVGIVVVTVVHQGSRSLSLSSFVQVGAIVVVVSAPLRAVGGGRCGHP